MCSQLTWYYQYHSHDRPLFQRVLEITNHHTGMSLEPPGQEDFTIIQYNADDQYTYVLCFVSFHFVVYCAGV